MKHHHLKTMLFYTDCKNYFYSLYIFSLLMISITKYKTREEKSEQWNRGCDSECFPSLTFLMFFHIFVFQSFMYVHTQIKQEAINGKFGHSLVFVTHFLLLVGDATCKVWNKSNCVHWFWTLNNETFVQCLWPLDSLGLYSMALKQFSPLLGCVASEQFNPIWRLIIQSYPRPKP